LQIKAGTPPIFLFARDDTVLVFLQDGFRNARSQNTEISKRQYKAPKVYVRDSGLLHSLLGIGSRRIPAPCARPAEAGPPGGDTRTGVVSLDGDGLRLKPPAQPRHQFLLVARIRLDGPSRESIWTTSGCCAARLTVATGRDGVPTYVVAAEPREERLSWRYLLAWASVVSSSLGSVACQAADLPESTVGFLRTFGSAAARRRLACRFLARS
jgi:hypothetical protein